MEYHHVLMGTLYLYLFGESSATYAAGVRTTADSGHPSAQHEQNSSQAAAYSVLHLRTPHSQHFVLANQTPAEQR